MSDIKSVDPAEPAHPIEQIYPIIVLLVDDQAMVGEMVRRALAGQADIALHHCSEASQAIGYIERLHPTVILQDLLLPDVDGLDLVREYRATPAIRNVPVIVLSVKEEPAVKSEAFRVGATDYLVKLPDPIELVARIRHHSRAYLNQIQRDQAYLALHESQVALVAANRELQRLSNSDGLTGIANRRYLEEYLSGEWRRALRARESLSVVMIDVDDFKRYNDTYGHLAGDEVLKSVGQMMRGCVERPADLAARFGGEEFILVLPDTTLPGALHVAERLRQRLEELKIAHSAATAATCITVSIGVASTVPVLATSSSRLVGEADTALYQAKKSGRNRVCGRVLDPAAI